MELFRALGALAERPDAGHASIARSIDLPGRPDAVTYTALFSMQLYPYASVYVGAEGMLGGEARDRVAGFWRALGVVPPAEPDHLATLLALYAELYERFQTETQPLQRAALERARSALLWEHLLPWLPSYAHKMREIGDEFYAAWADLLERTLLVETQEQAAGSFLPLHLREAAPLADPREEGARAFTGSLLAPVRSGFILVRDDLARAARELGLGLRQGERRFVLESLFAQERTAVIEWLETEALAAARRHRTMNGLPSLMQEFWALRASGTAALLRALLDAQFEPVETLAGSNV